MKTANEWFDKYKLNADKYLSMSAIEQIQLDAFKAGMTAAAQIADKWHGGNAGQSFGWETIKHAILAERDTKATL